ncbi:MAG: bifunctional (p)ppGpp synthetase/guanosine-3',5'-bis(diphosphate) 3'-pyrophosphohydrolase [Dehalococcoidia bacterium]
MYHAQLLSRTREYLPPERIAFVERAYQFAAKAHDGQMRRSGDPYITHPVAAAEIVAALQQDANTIAAALLHDVQEDCHVTPEELEREFNAEVARLVDGATKLEKVDWRTPGADGVQAENLRKMFLAMAEDVRVVIIKLADRLHNMRTLDYQAEDKRRRIAQETMDIFAPLAGRMGIWQIKWELEDLAFRHLNPERYREVAQLIASKRATRERYIAQVEKILSEELVRHGLTADVKGRAKHIYSVHQKMQRYAAEGKTFDQIYDLLALRVLVESVPDCYTALGIVHGLWHPIPGQFDDYIGSPKETTYQSLHTSVMCLGARPLEVQIRTHEMHRLAEYGIAAHWRYKEGGRQGARDLERMNWLRQLLDWQRELPSSSSEEFVETVKTDIFRDQVFVYTPKGDLKDLPAGATPLDFAYRIHTDLGHRCIGAKVNNRLVALNHTLQNGDIVEIITTKTPRGPSRDWLNANLGYIKTGNAREKVRQWFKRQERAENIERGRELLERELRRLSLTPSEWQEEVLRLFKYDTLDDLLAAIGYGGVTTDRIALRLTPLLEGRKETALPAPAPAPATPTPATGVSVLGTGELLTQLAVCCRPVPGDPIQGFVTRSRGVSVHRADCTNIQRTAERERLVEVSWGAAQQQYPVTVRVEAWDRVGLLRDLSAAPADDRINITGVHTAPHEDRTITVHLTVTITGLEQLTRLLHRIEGVRGVFAVARARDGARV